MVDGEAGVEQQVEGGISERRERRKRGNDSREGMRWN